MRLKHALIIGCMAVVACLATARVLSCNKEPEPASSIGIELVKQNQPLADQAKINLQVDTVLLERVVAKHDTVYQQMRITDTIWVREYITAAENTIDTCQRALGSCTTALQATERINEGLKLQLAAEKRKSPGIFSRVITAVSWGGVGYAACSAADVLKG